MTRWSLPPLSKMLILPFIVRLPLTSWGKSVIVSALAPDVSCSDWFVGETPVP